MERYKLNVENLCSISPSKLCITHRISKSYKNSLGYWEYREPYKFVSNSGITSSDVVTDENKVLKRKFHNFEISVNSARKLRCKIEYLFLYSRDRRIKTYSGKIIPKFKISFITLTIPSKQIHPTGVIVKQCLDEFLQVLRKRLGMLNYCWRLEFQANGNAHFHLVTDTYVDYYFALKHWNRCINILGYVDRYSESMNSLSFVEYCKKYGKNYKGKDVSNDVLFKRFTKGKSTNWKHPNSVDVKSAKSGDSIGFYISKYFSKKEKTAKCNVLDNEENSFGLRLCYWSRSLSRLSPEAIDFGYYEVNIWDYLMQDDTVLKCVYDYCTVLYFDIKKLSGIAKDYLLHYFDLVKNEAQYVPA